MNKILLAVLILFSVYSCEKADKFTQFNIEYNESVTIESSTGINLPFDIYSPDVETNSESKFAINDTRKELVEEIKLTKLDLTIRNPTDGDFSFLKSVEIYISAEGLDEVKIAWKENIDDNVGDYLELEVSEADIQEYIKKDEFSLRLNSVTDKVIAQDHEIDIHSVFYVDAKVFGQ